MEYLNGISNLGNGSTFWHGGHGDGFVPFHFGGIVPIVLIGLITFLSIRVFRSPAKVTGSPETILRRRYAAGEIDEQTYRTMKDELSNP